MAEISLSIAELFEKAFGYLPTAFERQLEAGLPRKKDPKTPDSPYANELTARKGSYLVAKDKFGFEYYMPVTLGDLPLEHPVVSVNCKKTLVETALTERQGTVKELISSEDWEITIRGLIISKDGGFPEDEMQELTDLFYKKESLELKCPITDIFLVHAEKEGKAYVVIKEMSLPEVKGIMNVRPYELKLVSDSPFNLEEV